MTSPQPIRLPEKTRELLDQAASVRAWPAEERERGWRRLANRGSRSSRPARRISWSLAFALVLVAGAWLFSRARPPATLPPAAPPPAPARVVQLGARGSVVLSPEATSEWVRHSADELSMELHGGHAAVRVPIDEPTPAVRIVTPSVRVVGFGRRFAVSVEGQITRVEVFDGELRLETAARSLTVHAGESLRSDDPRLAAAEEHADELPAKTPPRRARTAQYDECADLGEGAYSCYRQIALDSNGPSAANALYAMGVFARDRLHEPLAALSHFRAYQSRFPHGPLWPEATLAVIELTIRTGHASEASAEARKFLQRLPDHPAALRVRNIATQPKGD
jgi:hypothetical protein